MIPSASRFWTWRPWIFWTALAWWRAVSYTHLDGYKRQENTLFHFHENPNPDCPVGRNIHKILDGRRLKVQQAMERELQGMTMADVMADLKKNI